jgi:ABC-2 type transport system permease protein
MVFPTETETGAALKRLLQAKMPRVGFVQGELERSIDKAGDRHYKVLTNQITFRYSLVNQGFDVVALSLNSQEIPNDLTALVIADPKVGFDSIALRKIRQYIAVGGNLLIAGEPGKQDLLNPLLHPLGVQLMEGMLVQPSKNFSAELIQPYLTPAAAGFTKQIYQDREDSLVVTMRGAAALTYSSNGPFTVSPLVMTAERSSWNKKIKPTEDMIESSESEDAAANSGGGMVMMASMSGTAVSADGPLEKQKPAFKGLVFSPEQGDQKGSLPVVLGLSRTINGKQQRIVVSGDADFLSNSELSRSNIKTSNFDFSTAIFSWFANGEFPIDSFRPPSEDKSLTLTSKGLDFLKILLEGILPGLLLIIGSVLLIRRKRK